MRVLTVVGARPQFIKASVVSERLRDADVEEVLLHTGQHYDSNMSEVFFEELRIAPPTVNLGIKERTHGAMTAAMLAGIEAEILNRSPSVVLVYGDTNSTLAGALAGSKLNVPVAHVEAGLRSFNRRMPEEQNRVVADHLADLLLTPTAVGTENLRREGIDDARVVQVGDVMYDVAIRFGALVEESPSGVVDSLDLRGSPYVLATIHRAENTDDPTRMSVIIDVLEQISERLPVVFPVHPRTRSRLPKGLSEQVRLIDPVGYLDMVQLERAAELICTDSGGVQKEAYFHGVPCVTLRDETEWTELVDLGWNHLAPPEDADQVLKQVETAFESGPGASGTPYGDGHAAQRVVEELTARFS